MAAVVGMGTADSHCYSRMGVAVERDSGSWDSQEDTVWVAPVDIVDIAAPVEDIVGNPVLAVPAVVMLVLMLVLADTVVAVLAVLTADMVKGWTENRMSQVVA
jgi:hypothetical protein